MRHILLITGFVLAFTGAFYLDVSAQESAFEPGQKSYFITGADVRLRQKPSVDGKVIGNMEFGTPVTVLSRSEQPVEVGGLRDYWYEVKLSKGVHFWKNENQKEVTGWVFGPYVNGFEHESEFFDARQRILDEKAPVPSALYQKLAGYTWDQSSPLDYVPCFSGTIELKLSTVSIHEYECGPVYRILSMRDEGNSAVEVNAALIWHCNGEDYEAVPFPVQPMTIRLETNATLSQLKVTDPFSENVTEYLCYQSPVMMTVNGSNVRYRQFVQGSWLADAYSGNYEDYAVAGTWEQGRWLFLKESNHQEETINGKTAEWYLATPLDAEKEGLLTFGGYLKPVTATQLSELNAKPAQGEVWTRLAGHHWKGKTAVGDCEIIPHGAYAELRIGAQIRYFIFPDAGSAEVEFEQVSGSDTRMGGITGYRIEWAADGRQKCSQMYLLVREEGNSLRLQYLPLFNEVVMNAVN